MEIDLAAAATNLAAIRTMAGGAAVMPVVKAQGYGHGMLAVAAALEAAGADALCVATLDEALALRAAGITAEVIVLYPVPRDGLRDAADHAIVVTLGAGAIDGLSRDAGGAGGRAGAANPLRVELEVETGLGRGGVPPDAIVAAAERVAAAGAVLTGVWSHLQESEVEAITRDQVARFEAAIQALRATGIDVPRRHLAASAALLLGNVPRYDAVRPGLVTYGLIPDELEPARLGGAATLAAAATTPVTLGPGAADLRPLLSLHARPVRVADLGTGHGVSYGPTWRASRPSRIATLPLGYGDGWPRALSNRAEVLVRGVRAPVVGNVAMDATMIDVTDVPGAPVDVADEFVLIGRQGAAEITAAEVAQWRTTNSWEVVTAMSGRLTRVYHAPAGIAGPSAFAQETRWLASNSGTATSAISRSTRS